MKNLSICFAVIFLFCLSNLLAQDFAQKGIWELGGTINFVNSTSVSNGETAENSLSTFSLNVPVYYFVIDGLELGLIPQFQNLSSGGSSASLFALLAGIAYNLKSQSAAYPFIEGQLGFNTASNGTSRSGILWSLNAGAKVQIGSKGLARIGLFYEQRTLETSSNEGGRNGTNTWGLNVGFAVFFGN
jgi:hypothetical protein